MGRVAREVKPRGERHPARDASGRTGRGRGIGCWQQDRTQIEGEAAADLDEGWPVEVLDRVDDVHAAHRYGDALADPLPRRPPSARSRAGAKAA